MGGVPRGERQARSDLPGRQVGWRQNKKPRGMTAVRFISSAPVAEHVGRSLSPVGRDPRLSHGELLGVEHVPSTRASVRLRVFVESKDHAPSSRHTWIRARSNFQSPAASRSRLAAVHVHDPGLFHHRVQKAGRSGSGQQRPGFRASDVAVCPLCCTSQRNTRRPACLSCCTVGPRGRDQSFGRGSGRPPSAGCGRAFRSDRS